MIAAGGLQNNKLITGENKLADFQPYDNNGG